MRAASAEREIEFFIDNRLDGIHLVIEMIRCTGLAPSEFEFSFPQVYSAFLNMR